MPSQGLYERLGRGSETAALIGNGSIEGENCLWILNQRQVDASKNH